MTIIRGVQTLSASRCGAQYAFPQYVSMNFSAFEYWTDGWREGSLMPNDEGLRRCKCGQFVQIKDMVPVAKTEGSDTSEDEPNELPYMDCVPDELLTECITKASSENIEVAARLCYWRYLNHECRNRYRHHRDAEEAGTKAAWEAAHLEKKLGGTGYCIGKPRFTDVRRTVRSLTRASSQRMCNFKTCSVSTKSYLTGGKHLASGMS